MSKRSRRKRVPAVNRQPRQGASTTRETSGQAQVVVPYHGHYMLIQWYSIDANEQGIENWLARVSEQRRARAQEDAERFKRMQRAILAKKRARSQVCNYLVTAE